MPPDGFVERTAADCRRLYPDGDDVEAGVAQVRYRRRGRVPAV